MDTYAKALTRAGWSGVAAGPLLASFVGAELIWGEHETDGTVVEPLLFAGFVVTWVAGMLCIALTVLGVRAAYQSAQAPVARKTSIGARLLLWATGAQVLFGAVMGVSAAVTGEPWEPAFLFFAVGFLLFAVGGALLGFGLRRIPVLGSVAVPAWVGAAAGFAAIAIVGDPWHDVALFVFFGAWVVIGAQLLRAARGVADRATADQAGLTASSA